MHQTPRNSTYRRPTAAAAIGVKPFAVPNAGAGWVLQPRFRIGTIAERGCARLRMGHTVQYTRIQISGTPIFMLGCTPRKYFSFQALQVGRERANYGVLGPRYVLDTQRGRGELGQYLRLVVVVVSERSVSALRSPMWVWLSKGLSGVVVSDT